MKFECKRSTIILPSWYKLFCDLICDVIIYCVWSCDHMGKMVNDKIITENPKKMDVKEIWKPM